MNFTQMHERLRVELLRRVQRGSLSVSLLAHQTGFGQSHVSGFLHARGKLSLEALDRILESQHMVVEDLIELDGQGRQSVEGEGDAVPLVSHSTALSEPRIRPSGVQMTLQLPPGILHSLRSKPVTSRRWWDRFVAIRIDRDDARPMDPLLRPNAIAVIDRHYNSQVAYHDGKPNLCAIRNGAHLTLRYADYLSKRLILRPLSMAYPVDLIEIGPEESPGEYIAGRVTMLLSEV